MKANRDADDLHASAPPYGSTTARALRRATLGRADDGRNGQRTRLGQSPPLPALWGVLLLAALGVARTQAAPLTLAVDGQATSVIVVPARPSRAALEGARLLADYCARMSRGRFQVMRETELPAATVVEGRIEGAPAATVVLVGESALAAKLGATSAGLGPGGILIRTGPNAVVLLGPDDKTPSDPWGSRYAVTIFLEEALGCRYLWPGELGQVVPRNATIRIPATDTRFTPALRQRRIRSVAYQPRIQAGLDKLGIPKEDYLNSPISKTDDWFVWHKLGGTLNVRGGDGTLLPPETWTRFQKDHPEWFAMQVDGSREQAPGERRPRLCVSNPQLIAAIVQAKLEELKKSPGLGSVSLDVHDGGHTGFCMCPACKRLDPPEGPVTKVWTYDHAKKRLYWYDYVSLSDRMATFYNAVATGVAAEYPDVLFGASAYSSYAAPPLKVKLHPNIMVRFVGVYYHNEALRQRGLADWQAWQEMASKLYFRPNLMGGGRREGTPMVYVHKLAQDFRYLAHHGMLGTDFDSCFHNWATQGLIYYVCAKLHWNPDLDVDMLVDDYCRAGFGAAASDVKAYLMKVEALTDKMAAKELDFTAPYTPEAMTELRARLDAAAKAARGDDAAARRVAFLRCGLDFTAFQAEAYRALEQSKKAKLSKGALQEAQQLLARRWRLMRKMFTDEPLAVNVAYLSWGEGGRFQRLGWQGRPSAAELEAVEADEQGRPVAPAPR